MSRSGYHDDLDPLDQGRWTAQVRSATRGKRGQKFFCDLLAALDAMPEKKLISGRLQDDSGQVCSLGAIGVARGVDLKPLEPKENEWGDSEMDYEGLADNFDIAEQLAREVMFWNDEMDFSGSETPEARWKRMRAWVARQIRAAEGEEPANGRNSST